MADPERSTRLDLPFILPAQAQKHVTHNEAIQVLDALVQLSVQGFDATTPPVSPVEGQVFALGSAPDGAWAGHGGALAMRAQSSWLYLAPQDGWLAYDSAAQIYRVHRAGQWHAVLQNLTGLGIGTSSDSTNRLAVAAQATLLSHDGAGHQVVVNKADAAQTASLLFQSNWSGRAEMGIAGNDDFSIKVSPDGTSWTDAVSVNRTTGSVALATALPLASGGTGGTTAATARSGLGLGNAATGTVTTSTLDTTTGRHLRVGDFGVGGLAPSWTTTTDLNDIILGGSYTLSGSFANGPSGGGSVSGVLSVIRRAFNAGATVTQLLSRSGTEVALWVRTGTGNPVSWTAWSRLIGQNNILGTVSQSAGVPTGAVIERGSNANGEFVRFADGTQICTRQVALDGLSIATTHGGVFRSAPVSYTLPASFTSVQWADAVIGASDTANIRTGVIGSKLRYGAASGTLDWQDIVFLSALSATGSAGQITQVGLVALGRWF
ncbi:MAG: DUF2793 domain-containing protein [Roseinatronobacter sp.]